MKIQGYADLKRINDHRHINEAGEEFWYARELAVLLEYVEWRCFSSVIDRAMAACAFNGFPTAEHFFEYKKAIPMPMGAVKYVKDYRLTRFACYYIVQKSSSRKKVVARCQAYFSAQTVNPQQLLMKDSNDPSKVDYLLRIAQIQEMLAKQELSEIDYPRRLP